IEFINRVKEMYGEEYKVLGDYSTNKESIELLHSKCNNIFSIRPDNFIHNKNRCPLCYRYKSKKEEELFEFLKELDVGRIQQSNRTLLNGLELDIYLPDKNIAIEFNGLYWHSDIFKEKNFHLNKTELCSKL